MWFIHKWVFTSEGFGVPFLDLIKKALTYLNVPFTDPCCPEGGTGPDPFKLSAKKPESTQNTQTTQVENEALLEAVKTLFEEVQMLKTSIALIEEKQTK